MENGRRPKSATNEKKRDDERLSLFLFLSPPKRRREREDTTRAIAGISLFFVRAQLKKKQELLVLRGTVRDYKKRSVEK